MRNITIAFQVNKIISSVLEINPHIEQKEKPQNKYFLMAGENDEQSESESYSDSDSYYSVTIIIKYRIPKMKMTEDFSYLILSKT